MLVDDHRNAGGIHEADLLKIQHADLRGVSLDFCGDGLNIGFCAVVVNFSGERHRQPSFLQKTGKVHIASLLGKFAD